MSPRRPHPCHLCVGTGGKRKRRGDLGRAGLEIPRAAPALPWRGWGARRGARPLSPSSSSPSSSSSSPPALPWLPRKVPVVSPTPWCWGGSHVPAPSTQRGGCSHGDFRGTPLERGQRAVRGAGHPVPRSAPTPAGHPGGFWGPGAPQQPHGQRQGQARAGAVPVPGWAGRQVPVPGGQGEAVPAREAPRLPVLLPSIGDPEDLGPRCR